MTMIHLTLEAAQQEAERMLRAAGAAPGFARAMAEATVGAEARGIRSNGFAHLPDYIEGMKAGRIDGVAEPSVEEPLPAMMLADARGGTAHWAFAEARDRLAEKARTYGLALFACRGSFTTGELGHYAFAMAERGLVAIAATNGPPLLAVPGASRAIYCTNPVAFAAPRDNGSPVLIDQASSATAYVNLRMAAARGETIPEGWAIDDRGQPTTDAKAALKGALLSYGGARGGNMALMVEILAAGLSGANWSLDCPDFRSGSESPGCGLALIAIHPAGFGADFATRLQSQTERLSGLGVHVPGDRKAGMMADAARTGLKIDPAFLNR